MKPRILTAALVVGLAALSLPASAEGELPAACTKAPVITEEEQLVERTLYFHGDSAAGDVDGYSNFVIPVQENAQKMNATAPTSPAPKFDTNLSKSVYPATLPGNPIMSAWHTTINEDPLRIACFSFDYWAVGDGADMQVMLYPDSEFIVGTGSPSAIGASGDGENIVHYTARFRPSKPVVATTELYAQIEGSAPSVILYDSVDYPSSVTLVLIEPKPPAPAP